jgi:hypothetical protein
LTIYAAVPRWHIGDEEEPATGAQPGFVIAEDRLDASRDEPPAELGAGRAVGAPGDGAHGAGAGAAARAAATEVSGRLRGERRRAPPVSGRRVVSLVKDRVPRRGLRRRGGRARTVTPRVIFDGSLAKITPGVTFHAGHPRGPNPRAERDFLRAAKRPSLPPPRSRDAPQLRHCGGKTRPPSPLSNGHLEAADAAPTVTFSDSSHGWDPQSMRCLWNRHSTRPGTRSPGRTQS